MIAFDCPCCKTKKVSGRIIGALNRAENHSPGYNFSALVRCSHCASGSLVKVYHKRKTFQVDGKSIDPSQLSVILLDDDYSIIETLPEAQIKHSFIGYLPDSISESFLSAEFSMSGAFYSGAGMSYRAAIERTIRTKFPECIEKNLFLSINELGVKNLIPNGLVELLHSIRDKGNEGAHSLEELTKPEAELVQRFVHLFFIYTFELPAQLEEAKEASGIF